MSYATMMVNVDLAEASDAHIHLAADLADQFHAALIGVAACAPRPPVIGEGVMVPAEIELELKEISDLLAAKEKKFRAIANDGRRSVEWRSSNELPNDAIVEEARAADLIIIGKDRASGDPFRSVDPGSVLLRVGRPVLAVPRTVSSLKAKRILVAWQDSREARRAVQDSLPFLHQADEVLLTQVCDERAKDSAKSSVGDVARYLSRHRVMTNAGVMLKASGSVADELIRVAQYENVDLIVAGAYGHSRLGELIFGGVTRDLLAASPVCCLFSN